MPIQTPSTDKAQLMESFSQELGLPVRLLRIVKLLYRSHSPVRLIAPNVPRHSPGVTSYTFSNATGWQGWLDPRYRLEFENGKTIQCGVDALISQTRLRLAIFALLNYRFPRFSNANWHRLSQNLLNCLIEAEVSEKPKEKE